MSQSSLPPLLGDSDGYYRILIVGNSGAGKTTLASKLSSLLHIPRISLDEIFWEPNWEELPVDVFKSRVYAALEQNRSWVIDGNYRSKVGSAIEQQATDIIWLDPPLVLYFFRILKRTFKRIFFNEEICAPGCHETLRGALASRESILLWCLSQHGPVRSTYQKLSLGKKVEEGGVWHRLGGWNQLDLWVDRVLAFVKDV